MGEPGELAGECRRKYDWVIGILIAGRMSFTAFFDGALDNNGSDLF